MQIPSSTHVRLWRYEVTAGQREEFIRHYASDGTWAKLFETSEGFVGTLLWQDEKDASVFYTADHWTSAAAFDAFKQDAKARYEKLDQAFEALTAAECFLGAGNTP